MHCKPLVSLLIACALLASCDGSILVEVAVAEDTPDTNYQKILGIASGTGTKLVYFQNDSGIHTNVSGATNWQTPVANTSNGQIIESAIADDGKTIFYLRTTTNKYESEHRTKVGVAIWDDASNTFVDKGNLEVTGLPAGSTIKGLHDDLTLLVQESGTSYNLGKISWDGTNPKFTGAVTLDVSDAGTNQHDVGQYYTYTSGNDKKYGMLPIMTDENDADDESDDDDYRAVLHFFKIADDGTPTEWGGTGNRFVTGYTFKYRPAAFVVDDTVESQTSVYVLCTNSDFYKFDPETGKRTGEADFSYTYGTGCLMYLVRSGNTDYVITKPNYKSRAINVGYFPVTNPDTSFSGFADDTVRKGFAEYIDSDLVTTFYKVSDTDTEAKLLVGTNESGMVSITINKASAASNSSSNGDSSKSEEYTF